MNPGILRNIKSLADFNELWVTDSTLNEGTNSLINKRIGVG